MQFQFFAATTMLASVPTAHNCTPNHAALEGLAPSLHQPADAPALDSFNSEALLQGKKSITIVHNGAAYRLQATKLGKLILTK